MDKVSQVIRQEHHNQAVSSMPPSLCSLSLFLINRGIGLQFGLVPGQQGSLPWLSAAFSSLWKEDKKGKNLSDEHSLGGDLEKKGRRKSATEHGTEVDSKKRSIKSPLPLRAPKHGCVSIFWVFCICFIRNCHGMEKFWKKSETQKHP